MKKIFISQPMRGKSDEEILRERNRLTDITRDIIKKRFDDDIEVLDTFFEDFNGKALQFLAKGLMVLAEADFAVFAPGWEDARGCKIEHECCVKFNIPLLENII
jgi:hypothetical protein